MNRPGFPGECFICELRLPDHRFRWKHNKLFLLLPGKRKANAVCNTCSLQTKLELLLN
ncbi:hypothetical protein DRH05_004907 [Escherichia coli]|nr:hypothetical protein [Escherichia coli]